MSRLTRAEREDRKWAVCRRCGHYAVEHHGHQGACMHLDPDVQDPTHRDRCDCGPFDPPAVR